MAKAAFLEALLEDDTKTRKKSEQTSKAQEQAALAHYVEMKAVMADYMEKQEQRSKAQYQTAQTHFAEMIAVMDDRAEKQEMKAVMGNCAEKEEQMWKAHVP
jgi:hypothetical protein